MGRLRHIRSDRIFVESLFRWETVIPVKGERSDLILFDSLESCLEVDAPLVSTVILSESCFCVRAGCDGAMEYRKAHR